MHFGKSDPAINDALLKACQMIDPDIYILSGDFTQRALTSEFESAAAFIKLLRRPKKRVVAIPGNHDIEPLYKPLARIRRPYERYTEYISPRTSTSYVDSEIVIASINTVRIARIKDGGVSRRALNDAESWFSKQSARAVRLLVTHHPLDLPTTVSKRKLVRKATRSVYQLARSRVDLYLSGHYHRSSAVVTSARYAKDHHAAIALQAGTVSTRSRGQTQSFNVLHVAQERIEITVYSRDEKSGKFKRSEKTRFVLTPTGWMPTGIGTSK